MSFGSVEDLLESPNLLGRGTYGIVIAEGDVAIKLSLDHTVSEAIRELIFLRRCAQVENSGVVSVISATVADVGGGLVIAIRMPRYRCSLHDEWKSSTTPPSMRTIESYMCDLVAAVAHVHSCGIIHADIKPKNILVGASDDGGPGRLVLCDFGLSIFAAENGHTVAVQTPGYRAPELSGLESPAKYGYEIDVWSLGVVMIEIIRGSYVPYEKYPTDPMGCARKLFGLNDEADIALMAEIGRVDRIRRLMGLRNFDTTDVFGLDCLINRVLRIDPGSRPSAADVAGWVGVLFRREMICEPAWVPPTIPTAPADSPVRAYTSSSQVADFAHQNFIDLTARLGKFAPSRVEIQSCVIRGAALTRRNSDIYDRFANRGSMKKICAEAIYTIMR